MGSTSGSLEHYGGYDEVVTAMREAWRVLKPGGICTVSTEFRLEGPPPGIPGVLMFDRDELERYVLGSCPWGAFGEIDLSSPTTSSMQPASYAASTVTIRRYERRFSLLDLAKIDMPWPHVALHHEGRTWTSCHLALQKPE